MLNSIVTLKSGLEVTQGRSNWYHSQAWVFAFCSNYGAILYCLQDIVSYWSLSFGVAHMPTLRSASQAGPVCNPREGTSVVLRDTIRLT